MTAVLAPQLFAIRLSNQPTTVARARRAVRYNLRSYSADVIDRVELCTSEAVTNAIVHSDSRLDGGLVTLVIIELTDRVRIEVIDDGSSTSAPQLGDDNIFADNGRGLFLIEAMCSEWGWFADSAGRTAWFEVPVT